MGYVIEDEVRDTMEICECGLAKEMCCWDELSDEALVGFERLLDESAPWGHHWTYDNWVVDQLPMADDWQDWLMGL